MMQEQQIQEFILNQTTDWLQEDLKIMEQEFPLHREQITASLAGALTGICQQGYELQQTTNKGPAAYLCISFLRTNLLDDNWQYRLDLYDERFYQDSIECTESWELDFIWQLLQRRMNQFMETIRYSLYANKIRSYHITQIRQTMAEQYQQAAILLTGTIIPETVQQLDTAGINLAAVVTLLMGEYQDYSVALYEWQCDAKKKDEALCNISG